MNDILEHLHPDDRPRVWHVIVLLWIAFCLTLGAGCLGMALAALMEAV